MIIAIDIRHLTTPRTSGVGHYTIRLIEEMAKTSPEDVFILFAAGRRRTLAHLPEFDAPNIRVTTSHIPNRFLFALLRLPFGPTLENFLKVKPDVWFFPNLNITRTKLPYILTVHDLSFKLFPKFYTFKDRVWYKVARTERFINEATHLLAVSNSTKYDLVELLKVDPNKILVTHLGVDNEYSHGELPSDKNYLHKHKIDYPYLLTLSTLEPRKNIETAIEAYSAWRAKLGSSTFQGEVRRGFGQTSIPHLIIAGGKGWRTHGINEVLKHSKFKDDIHLIGYVIDKHKPALYRHAKAFLFPSFYEGFGLPVLEAMACGTPVITSFTGSMPEVVGDAAIMIDPFDVSDLELALEQLSCRRGRSCTCPNEVESKWQPQGLPLREKLIARGLKRASRFRWEQTAQLTLDAIHQIK